MSTICFEQGDKCRRDLHYLMKIVSSRCMNYDGVGPDADDKSARKKTAGKEV